MKRDYPENLIPMLVDGKVQPINGRVLVKVVHMQDIHTGGLILQTNTMRTAPYHEIIAVAEDIDDPRLKPGALCLFATTSADFADHTQGAECPYTLVKQEHIIAVEL